MSGRVVGILVARMGSTRVPGKALADLAGAPVLWHVLEASRAVRGLDELCIATGDASGDDPLAELARRWDVRCVRGDPERLLDRIHFAARQTDAGTVVHLQGDCPLLDPALTSDALARYLAEPCDYLCNYEPPTFPEGLDVNVVRFDALDRAHREALAPSQRVHPYSYITRHQELFTVRNYETSPDLSHHHWSLDFPEDLDFLRAVYARAHQPGRALAMKDVLELIERDAEIRALDRELQRPVVGHAFWNSPGIMRDMNADLIALAGQALERAASGDHETERRCYDEAERIAAELARAAEASASLAGELPGGPAG